MRVFFFIFSFFWTLSLSAQFLDTKILTANDGLISNNIQVAYTDSEGRLWLGSRAGLVQKSGEKMKDVPAALHYKFNNIYDIIETPNGSKWIAGYGQGVLIFNNEKKNLINETNGLANDIVRTLYYTNNKVYVGTLNGVSIISTNDFSIQNPKFDQNETHFFTITSFFESNHKIYATTLNDGIYEVTSTKLNKVSNLDRIFSSFVYNNRLFIGTQTNLYELDKKTFELKNTFPISNVHQFLSVKNQLYLVSSGIFENKGGLFQLNDSQFIDITTKYHLPFTDLKSIAYDNKNEYLYIGTNYNGLLQVNLDALVHHDQSVEAVQTLCVDENKQYVFHNNGFSIIQNGTKFKELALADFKIYQQKNAQKHKDLAVIENHFYPFDAATPASKIRFYQAKIHKNSLWVASNIGMYQLDLEGKILSYHPVHVFQFTFFNDELITAVPYAGVRIFHDIHKMDYDYFHDWERPEIPTDIVSMTQTHNAIYFASALSGLYEYKEGVFRSLMEDQLFSEPKIKRITTVNNQQLVVVTDFNEVYVLDTSTANFNTIHHLPYTKIKGNSTNFVEEIDGTMYIGTNKGINVFKGSQYYFIDKAQGFTNYNSRMATVHGNDLYIATNDGFYLLDHAALIENRASNDHVTIEAVYVNNELISQNAIKNLIELPHNENNIRLAFSVPYAKYPDKLHFKYRLKEDEPWQELTDDYLLNLNYLGTGAYQIDLQITNEDTGSVSVQTLLYLTIKPPFYLTIPFIAVSGMALIALSFVVFRGRMHQLKQKQARERALTELERQQELKTLMFEKQLADVKLQALKSQMNSHFLFNVLNSIQYFILSNEVDQALYYLEQFSQLIRTTLNYSDKKSIRLSDEIAYLEQYIAIENLRATHPILLETQVDKDIEIETIKVVPLLLQPFIENAIVHAFPDSISQPKIILKVENTTKGHRLTIADNGIGYQPKKSNLHESKGISIAQKRLQLTQKSLQTPIEFSSTDQGTQVVLYID